jgi:tetratricopeptide (TPR) repeat protein
MKVKSLTPQQLGRRIRSLRLDQGLSQEELAEPHYTAAYISHVEHGKRRASQEALGHLAERLGVTVEQLLSGRDPNENLRLEVQIQQAIGDIHAGRVQEARDVLEAARARAQEVGHERAVAQAELGIAFALYRLGDLDESLATYVRAASATSDEPPEARTSALVGQARCLFQRGAMRDAIHLLESHLIELQRNDPPDPSRLVETYAALIPAYFESGLIERAKDVASKGLALAPDIPDLEQRACLYVNRGQLMVTQGQPREALTSLAIAEDLYRYLGWHSESMKVTLAKSFVLTDQGRFAEAEELLRAALETGGAINAADRVRSLTRLALVRRRQGSPQEALELAREAMQEGESSFPVSVAEAAREAGLCARDLDDDDAALSYWRQALELFRAHGHHEEIARTARLIGDHLLEAGDPQAAAEAYKQGLTSVTELR